MQLQVPFYSAIIGTRYPQPLVHIDALHDAKTCRAFEGVSDRGQAFARRRWRIEAREVPASRPIFRFASVDTSRAAAPIAPGEATAPDAAGGFAVDLRVLLHATAKMANAANCMSAVSLFSYLYMHFQSRSLLATKDRGTRMRGSVAMR